MWTVYGVDICEVPLWLTNQDLKNMVRVYGETHQNAAETARFLNHVHPNVRYDISHFVPNRGQGGGPGGYKNC